MVKRLFIAAICAASFAVARMSDALAVATERIDRFGQALKRVADAMVTRLFRDSGTIFRSIFPPLAIVAAGPAPGAYRSAFVDRHEARSKRRAAARGG